MELSLFHPWYLLTYRQRDLQDGKLQEVGKTVFLADIRSVEQFVSNECSESILFDAVQIVTPGQINGSTHWKMEPLKAVWLSSEPGMDQTADIFETFDGVFYSNSTLGTPVNELTERKIRFLAPTAGISQSSTVSQRQ